MNRTMMPLVALAVFFCGVGTGVAEALAQKTKPNFVVIFIDDMGYGEPPLKWFQCPGLPLMRDTKVTGLVKI